MFCTINLFVFVSDKVVLINIIVHIINIHCRAISGESSGGAKNINLNTGIKKSPPVSSENRDFAFSSTGEDICLKQFITILSVFYFLITTLIVFVKSPAFMVHRYNPAASF